MSSSNENTVIHAIGRRKTAVSRVYLTQGNGTIAVNKMAFEAYFDTIEQKHAVERPLHLLKVLKDFNVKCFVSGGGKRAQADAVLLAIARALKAYEAKHFSERLEAPSEESQADQPPSWHTQLKRAGMLTTDSRQVERKKFGLRGARRRRQYSKR